MIVPPAGEFFQFGKAIVADAADEFRWNGAARFFTAPAAPGGVALQDRAGRLIRQDDRVIAAIQIAFPNIRLSDSLVWKFRVLENPADQPLSIDCANPR